ncbi:MAG TPA: hypothetical protein VGL56_19160 [Fimbriimonadaceae bacterium]|jgi:hypothetical protein
MRARRTIITIGAIALVGACLAQKPQTDFKSFTKILTVSEAKALEQKDSKFFEKLYSPDFKTKDERGVTNGKKVALFLLRYHFNTLNNVHYSTKILSLQSTGNTGTVTMMTVLTGTTKGRNFTPGGPIKVTRVEKRVFVKNGNQWLMSLDEDIKKPLVLSPAMSSPATLKPVRKN